MHHYVEHLIKNYEEIIVNLDFDGPCMYVEVPGSTGDEVSGGGT